MSIFSNKKNYILLGTLIAITLLILTASSQSRTENISDGVSTEDITSDEEGVPPPEADDRYRWKADSDITVVNYFSLDCPHCRELFLKETTLRPFYEQTFSLIYRHSPLPSIQPLSGEKAVIGECVRLERGDDVFFEFVHDVYATYQKKHDNNKWVKDIARSFVVDFERFDTCLKSEGVTIVEAERRETLSYRVYGTPTIVVFQGEKEILRIDRTNAQTVLQIMDSLRSTESL